MLLNLCSVHIRVAQPIKKKIHANCSKCQFTWKHKLNLDTCIVRLIGSAAGKNNFHFMAVFAYESTGRPFLCSTVSASSLVKWSFDIPNVLHLSGQAQRPARTRETEFVFLTLQQAELNTTSAHCSPIIIGRSGQSSTSLPLLFVWCDFKYVELGATSKGTSMLCRVRRVGREPARLSSASNVEQLSWDSAKSRTLLGPV